MFPATILETLPRHLLLGRSNGGVGVGINKSAAILASLELGGLSRADAHTAGVRAAPRAAVGVVDASTRNELLAVTGANILGARVVRSDGCGGKGNFGDGQDL